MQEIFADKPWVKPLTVAGSHIAEEEQKEQKENTSQEQCKMKYTCKVNDLCLDIHSTYFWFYR